MSNFTNLEIPRASLQVRNSGGHPIGHSWEHTDHCVVVSRPLHLYRNPNDLTDAIYSGTDLVIKGPIIPDAVAHGQSTNLGEKATIEPKKKLGCEERMVMRWVRVRVRVSRPVRNDEMVVHPNVRLPDPAIKLEDGGLKRKRKDHKRQNHKKKNLGMHHSQKKRNRHQTGWDGRKERLVRIKEGNGYIDPFFLEQ